jgi:hypothetical protein
MRSQSAIGYANFDRDKFLAKKDSRCDPTVAHLYFQVFYWFFPIRCHGILRAIGFIEKPQTSLWGFDHTKRRVTVPSQYGASLACTSAESHCNKNAKMAGKC